MCRSVVAVRVLVVVGSDRTHRRSRVGGSARRTSVLARTAAADHWYYHYWWLMSNFRVEPGGGSGRALRRCWDEMLYLI